ncbi:MAG: DUF3006 domain-containing protein [archaeon]
MFVDRIEKVSGKKIAVVEVDIGKTIDMPVELFDGRVKEGDAIFQDENGKWRIDREYTKKRKKYIDKLMDELFEEGDDEK